MVYKKTPPPSSAGLGAAHRVAREVRVCRVLPTAEESRTTIRTSKKNIPSILIVEQEGGEVKKADDDSISVVAPKASPVSAAIEDSVVDTRIGQRMSSSIVPTMTTSNDPSARFHIGTQRQHHFELRRRGNDFMCCRLRSVS